MASESWCMDLLLLLSFITVSYTAYASCMYGATCKPRKGIIVRVDLPTDFLLTSNHGECCLKYWLYNFASPQILQNVH